MHYGLLLASALYTGTRHRDHTVFPIPTDISHDQAILWTIHQISISSLTDKTKDQADQAEQLLTKLFSTFQLFSIQIVLLHPREISCYPDVHKSDYKIMLRKEIMILKLHFSNFLNSVNDTLLIIFIQLHILCCITDLSQHEYEPKQFWMKTIHKKRFHKKPPIITL